MGQLGRVSRGLCTQRSPQQHLGDLSQQIGSEEAQALSNGDGLGAAAHAEFAIDTVDLGFNCMDRDGHFSGHLAVRPSSDEQRQYPLLLPAQRLAESLLSDMRWCIWQGLWCGGRWSGLFLDRPGLLLLE